MDLTSIITLLEDYIVIDEEFTIDSSKHLNTDIKALDKVRLNGKVIRESDDNIYVKGQVSGKMLISDSISLDDVWYPFSFEINENVTERSEKLENYLDIIELLWQNIVLEVPLRYSLVDDYSKYQGDGWKLVSEEELHNNPFAQLKYIEDRSDKDGSSF